MTGTQPSEPQYPYPGLRPFEPHESHLFFGRDEQVFEMFSLLEEHRFLAVVGASGCGKSSLVRAGLLPRLRDEGLLNQRDGDWHCLIMRPGDSPLNALADACHQPDRVTGKTLARHNLHSGDSHMTRVVLESGPKGFNRVLADARVPQATTFCYSWTSSKSCSASQHFATAPVAQRVSDSRTSPSNS